MGRRGVSPGGAGLEGLPARDQAKQEEPRWGRNPLAGTLEWGTFQAWGHSQRQGQVLLYTVCGDQRRHVWPQEGPEKTWMHKPRSDRPKKPGGWGCREQDHRGRK